MAELLPSFVGKLLGDTTDFVSKMKGAHQLVESTAGGIESRAGVMSQKVGVGMGALGGLATGAGAALEHLGHGLEVAHGGLEVAVRNSGAAMETYNRQIDETVKHQEHFGHGAADSETALATLVRATGNTGTALKDMSLVTEIAALHHTSLADAANTVAKMHGGAFKVLKEFGINTKDTAKQVAELNRAETEDSAASAKLSDAQQKLAELHERLAGKTRLSVSEQQSLRHAQDAVTEAAAKQVEAHGKLERAQNASTGAMTFNKAAALVMAKAHGTAEAQADTFGGKVDALKTRLTDMASVVGAKVGPALTVAGPALMGVSAILSSNVLPTIGKAIAGMAEMAGEAVVWAATTVASAVSAAAGWVVDMALMTGSAIAAGAAMILPFLPVIAILAAVGIAAYELYTHWDTVFGFVKGLVLDAWHFITDHLTLIAAAVLWPIAPLILVATHWKEIWGGIQDVAAGAWHGIEAGMKAGINAVIGGLNAFIHMIDRLQIHIPSIGVGPLRTPGFDWSGLQIPDIPKLDVGGTITRGGVVDIHANERVFMPTGASVIPLNRGGIGGGGTVYNLHVHLDGATVLGGDKRQLAQDMVKEIRTELIRTGGRQALGLPA